MLGGPHCFPLRTFEASSLEPNQLLLKPRQSSPATKRKIAEIVLESQRFLIVHLAFGDFSRPKDCRPLLHIYVVVNVIRIDRVDLIVRHVDDLRRVHLEHLVLPVVLQVSTLVKD